jgi:DNA-binding transcriptional regulator GbsR (MarR family)
MNVVMSPQTELVPPELEDVANQVGVFIEYWGFKNVHGRIWAHLFLSSTPLDAGQIMDRLKISKALTSMSLSELMQNDVIQVAGKGDRGSVLYKANTDLISIISNVLRSRERRMLCRTSAAAKNLKGLPNDKRKTVELDSSRVNCLINMIEQAEKCLDGFLAMSKVDFSSLSDFTALLTPNPEKT